MALLDRQSPMPLWAQLLDDLRRRLATDEFNGDFPTEEQLTHTYGVSRHTVREALRRLQADGLLVRRPGKGTAVAAQRFEQPLHGPYRLADTLRAHGSEHSHVLAAEVRPAGPAAGVLGLDASDDVVTVQRVRFAGDDPVAVDQSWFPRAVGEPLLHVSLEDGSIYDALAVHSGVRITGGSERISARPASPADRRLLRLPRGVAVLAVERLALVGGRPVEWRRSSLRGDRFDLRSDWPDLVATQRDLAVEGHDAEP